jgi:hypothetical protein
MTLKRDWFKEYKPMTTSFIVYIGNDTKKQITSVKTLFLDNFILVTYYQGHKCYACANIEKEPTLC